MSCNNETRLVKFKPDLANKELTNRPQVRGNVEKMLENEFISSKAFSPESATESPQRRKLGENCWISKRFCFDNSAVTWMMGNDGKNKKTAPTSLTQKLPLSRPTEKMQANYFNFGAKKKTAGRWRLSWQFFPFLSTAHLSRPMANRCANRRKQQPRFLGEIFHDLGCQLSIFWLKLNSGSNS